MTMTYSELGPLTIFDVLDPGQPNLERVAIYVTEECDLGNYCLGLAHRNFDGTSTPVRDQVFWFGSGYVQAEDWIFVYTAAGTLHIEKNPSGNSHFHVHWGKDHTIFQNRALVPMLIEINATAIPPLPQPVPQTPYLK